MRAIMTKASELLIGVPCRIDIKPIRAGERYVDDRGVAMWERVMRALAEAEDGRDRQPDPGAEPGPGGAGGGAGRRIGRDRKYRTGAQVGVAPARRWCRTGATPYL